MAATGTGTRRVWAAVLAGLAWAQGGIAVTLVVLPKYVVPGDLIANSRWYRLASWTLLAPVTLASRLAQGNTTAGPPAEAVGLSLAALLVGPVLAVGLCLPASWGLGSPKWRRCAACGIATVAVLGAASGIAVALQLRDAALAEKTFFAMVSRVDAPHKDAATVTAAREFTERHPDSRWAGEALRIVAMSEGDAGRFEVASVLWSRFASRFSDRTAPGVAFAEYNRALCDEHLGNDRAAQSHLHAAIETIRARGDGIQAWIATDAAKRLSVLERSEGQYALASYWKTKSRTFADVYSTE